MSGRSIHLIDRDELLATLEQDINVSVTGEENMEAVRRCLQEMLDDVKESPVVDAVQVIRCKDCDHIQSALLGNSQAWLCMKLHRQVREHNYCCWAERKEE